MCGFTVLHGQYFGTRLTRKMFKIFLPLRTDSLKEELVSHTTLLETVSIVGQCKCMFFAHSQECSANTLESLTGASGHAVVLITRSAAMMFSDLFVTPKAMRSSNT